MKGFRRTVIGEMLHGWPPVIRWLVVSCVGIWFAELIIFSTRWRFGQELVLEWLALKDPFPWLWQFVTYAFLHDPLNPMHVGINMLMLWMFGRELAARWRTGPFMQFYLVCAVGAGLCHVLAMAVLPSPVDQFGRVLGHAPVVGASGAVLGLLAAYGVLFPDRTLLFFFLIPMKAKYAVLIAAGIELLSAWNPNHGVANFAHLGGMLTAYLYLKQGWRLARFSPFGWFKGRMSSMSRRRRRARFEVVDEKEWDEWLERELEDETRH